MSDVSTPRASGGRRAICSASVGFCVTFFVLGVALFQLLRLMLYLRNRELSAGASVATIASAFWFGLRFDMSTVAYVTLPLLLTGRFVALCWGIRLERRVYIIGGCLVGVVCIVLGVAELEFYHEFSCRFNRIVVNYLSQPGTVCTMVWRGF